jgi:hypothetical protein
MEGLISILQLPDADLQSCRQVWLVKIRVGNDGIKDKTYPNG